jgi:hypothetical protein
MKIFQVIIFVSAVTFFCCACHASFDVDVEQAFVKENPIVEYNLIDKAIKIVEGGVPSILGVKTLVLYADSYSPSVKANFWSGKFGVQSEQSQARFLKVLEIDPEYTKACINLLNLYVNMEDFNATVELYRKYPHLKSDSHLSKDFDEMINILESDIIVVSGPNE